MNFNEKFQAFLKNPSPQAFLTVLRQHLKGKPLKDFPTQYQSFKTWWDSEYNQSSGYFTFISSRTLSIAGQVKHKIRALGHDPDQFVMIVIKEALEIYWMEGLQTIQRAFPGIDTENKAIEVETQILVLGSNMLNLCGLSQRELMRKLFQAVVNDQSQHPSLLWLNNGMKNYKIDYVPNLVEMIYERSQPAKFKEIKAKTKEALALSLTDLSNNASTVTDRIAARAFVQLLQSDANARSSNAEVEKWIAISSALTCSVFTSIYFPFVTSLALVVGHMGKSVFESPGWKNAFFGQILSDYRNVGVTLVAVSAAMAETSVAWAISPFVTSYNWIMDNQVEVKLQFEDSFKLVSQEIRFVVLPLLYYCKSNLRDQYFLSLRPGALKVNFMVDLLAQIYYLDKPQEQLAVMSYLFPHPNPLVRKIGETKSCVEPSLQEKITDLARILESGRNNEMVKDGKAKLAYDRALTYLNYLGAQKEDKPLRLMFKLWETITAYDNYVNSQYGSLFVERDGIRKSRLFWNYLAEIEVYLFSKDSDKTSRYQAIKEKTVALKDQFIEGSESFKAMVKIYEDIQHLHAIWKLPLDSRLKSLETEARIYP